MQVPIYTPEITLDQLLKLADLVGSGGEAKVSIQEGRVKVNGEPETRRGRKLRPGDRVDFDGMELEVVKA